MECDNLLIIYWNKIKQDIIISRKNNVFWQEKIAGFKVNLVSATYWYILQFPWYRRNFILIYQYFKYPDRCQGIMNEAVAYLNRGCSRKKELKGITGVIMHLFRWPGYYGLCNCQTILIATGLMQVPIIHRFLSIAKVSSGLHRQPCQAKC